jgi:hypothetical protein
MSSKYQKIWLKTKLTAVLWLYCFCLGYKKAALKSFLGYFVSKTCKEKKNKLALR